MLFMWKDERDSKGNYPNIQDPITKNTRESYYEFIGVQVDGC